MKKYQYKVRAIQTSLQLEKTLNEMANEGWRLCQVAENFLIFEKEETER